MEVGRKRSLKLFEVVRLYAKDPNSMHRLVLMAAYQRAPA